MITDGVVKSTGVLVTGSNGFVGSHMCAMLSERGWRVVAASREKKSDSPNSEIINVCVPLLTDEAKWRSALQTVHCVIHLAALAHVSRSAGKSGAEFQRINVDGTRFVAEQAARSGVRRFIFLSSIKVNGEGGSLRRYRADDIPDPQDAYARSKFDAERSLQDICSGGEMELVIIRPPLVYGPGVRANFRRLLQLTALGIPLPFGSIDNRRSMIGVWNLVSFSEVCVLHPDAAGKIWLVSDGEDLSTTELLRRLTRLMLKPQRLFPISPLILRRIARIIGVTAEINRLCDSLVIDSMPAFERLNWQSTTSVDQGLARTVAAFRAERNR